MLSRRNIRIKLLQILYGYAVDESLTSKSVQRTYEESVGASFQILLYVVCALEKVAAYSVEDKNKRRDKYIQEKDDRRFRDWLYRNSVLEAIKKSDLKKSIPDQLKISMTPEITKKCYKAFSNEDVYKQYSQQEEPTEAEHVLIFLELMKFLLKNEHFLELLEDQFIAYDSDISLLKGALKKIIKKLPEDPNYYKTLYPDKDTVEVFGTTLLIKYLEEEIELDDQVKGYLRNWDVKRIAIIDRIILKMALIEFLYFDSIPIKVTLNEYLELAKSYSTDKSREFVNGILDNMMNDLKSQGKISKKGRGLVE